MQNHQFIIEEGPLDPESTRIFELAGRNRRWLNDHAMELRVFELYRGRCLAASKGQLFVGDSPEEVERLALEKHPEDVPHILYVPREKAYRIYTYRW
jgi:hypothetical protein